MIELRKYLVFFAYQFPGFLQDLPPISLFPFYILMVNGCLLSSFLIRSPNYFRVSSQDSLKFNKGIYNDLPKIVIASSKLEVVLLHRQLADLAVWPLSGSDRLWGVYK